MRLSSTIALLSVLSLFTLVPLAGQVATGTIDITVADSTGGMLPGASIRVTNNGTGLARAGTASERGELNIPYLPVGSYSISVELVGFKRTTIDQVVLQVDHITFEFRYQYHTVLHTYTKQSDEAYTCRNIKVYVGDQ